MADIRANAILRDPANTYLGSSLTPSQSRQAPPGAPADGLQHATASQPISRVGPGHVYFLRVLVNYHVVHRMTFRLLWRTT